MKLFKPAAYHFIFSLIGFTAVIAQILYIREFIVVFYGNEISLGIILANWLLWTAAGSYLLGKLAKKIEKIHLLMGLLQVLIAIFTPLTIVMIRFSITILHTTPGEILGLLPIYINSFILLSFFCFLSGGLFSAGSYFYAKIEKQNIALSSGYIYLMEAAGAAIGGLLISLLLIPKFSSIQISLFVSFCNILAAAYLTTKCLRSAKKIIAIFFYTALIVILIFSGIRFDSPSHYFPWQGFQALESYNSKYGNLMVVEVKGSKTLYENGLAVFNVPGREKAEEAVHYALLQHPQPQRLLLIGGGIAGSVREALKHPSLKNIDYVELDPAILELGKRHFKENWKDIQNPRVSVHHTDGRLFLKQSSKRYDVIIVDLPDPHTAQLNRFYTREFFGTAAEKLNPDGILSFQVSASENYITDELAKYLRCINKTLQTVFPKTAFIPGNTVHFFASNTSNELVINSDVLISRLRERNIQTQYIREYFIPFRLTPDRVQDLNNLIEPKEQTPINKDFFPVVYYFDSILWSSQFLPDIRGLFYLSEGLKFYKLILGLIIVLLTLIIFFRLKFTVKKYKRTCTGFAVISMGFSLMSFELLLLLAFQAIYGYVYHQLAILITFFMIGIAVGSWLSLKYLNNDKPFKTIKYNIYFLGLVHLIAAILPLILFALFKVIAGVTNPVFNILFSQIIFPVLTLFCGILGGYQFPLASRIFFGNETDKSQNAGILYGLDLIGALLGALILSAFIIPLFGFYNTSILLAVLNLIVLLSVGLGLYHSTSSD
jgi:spermidine synthase